MKKILVVVDMQNDFIDGALGSKEAVSIVENAVDKINCFDGDIIVTYDTHTEEYMDTREGRFLPVKHCVKGTGGHKLNEKIAAALKDKSYKEIEKPTFGSAELVEYIKDNYDTQNTQIEFIGLCTDICVVSNVMLVKANFPEMNVYVDEKCCAGVTPEKHNAAIEVMKSCQVEII